MDFAPIPRHHRRHGHDHLRRRDPLAAAGGARGHDPGSDRHADAPPATAPGRRRPGAAARAGIGLAWTRTACCAAASCPTRGMGRAVGGMMDAFGRAASHLRRLFGPHCEPGFGRLSGSELHPRLGRGFSLIDCGCRTDNPISRPIWWLPENWGSLWEAGGAFQATVRAPIWVGLTARDVIGGWGTANGQLKAGRRGSGANAERLAWGDG
jgi:hypothetical protein